MKVKQPIPISLDSFQINPKLMHTPIMLKDFIEQYRENRGTIAKQENPKASFQKFLNSFLVDTLISIAAILTHILSPCNNICSYRSIKIKSINYHHSLTKS